MKKRILLVALMVALLACLFVISASAAEFDKSEVVTVKLSDGSTQQCPLYDADGDALVWYTLDSGATVVSVKTKDLYYNTTGGKLVEHTELADIYLNAETLLQKKSENTTNKIVVANLRDCTFKGIYHSNYKTTFMGSGLVQYVYIPSTLASMDCNSFQSCSNLKVCDIPSDASFKITSANNFNGCSSLMEINLIGCYEIKGVICHSNFSGCTSLTKVVIDPATINWPSIGGNEFNGCPLTQFGLIPGECTIPASTTKIENNGFKYSRFTKVNLASGQLKTMGYNTFESNPNLTEISFPTTLESMGVCVFMNCPNIQTLVGFENTALTAIPDDTFNKSGLTTVILPSTCKTIGLRAFADDGNRKISTLTSVTIPAGITLIDDNAFQNCAKLKTVTFLGNAGQNAVIDQAAFENCYALESIVIPEGVTTLGNCVFKYAKGLKSVTFPSTLTTINGGENFLSTALTEVIGLENTQITSIPGSMFRYVRTWQPDMIVLPNTVETLGTYSFADVGMRAIKLGNGLTTIGNESFSACFNLEAIYIPSSVSTLTLNDAMKDVSKRLIFTTAKTADTLTISSSYVSKTDSNVITYEQYLAGKDTTYATGTWIITGVNTCDVFYNSIHTLDPEQSNACAGLCKTCNEIQQAQNPEHEWHTTITYADFAKNGEKLVVCTHKNCAMAKAEPTSVEPIFVYLGFATEKNSVSQFCVGYLINQAELEAYKQANQTEAISYGLVATAIANTNAPIGADGNRVNEKVVQANLSSVENAEEILSVDFIIKGDFTNETNAYAELGMALYVTRTIGEVTEVSYVGNAGSTATIDAVTFADKFPELLPKKEEIA